MSGLSANFSRPHEMTAELEQLRYLVFEGMAGKAPRVNATNNHWEVYDVETAQWVDTGANVTGADGVSPGVFISSAFNGKTIKITDAQHPDGQFFTIYNGTNGLSPYIDTTTKTWWYYDDASNLWVDSNIHAQGDAGVSPKVTVTTITGGHTVTITDEDHPQGQSFNVLDGAIVGTLQADGTLYVEDMNLVADFDSEVF